MSGMWKLSLLNVRGVEIEPTVLIDQQAQFPHPTLTITLTFNYITVTYASQFFYIETLQCTYIIVFMNDPNNKRVLLLFYWFL